MRPRRGIGRAKRGGALPLVLVPLLAGLLGCGAPLGTAPPGPRADAARAHCTGDARAAASGAAVSPPAPPPPPPARPPEIAQLPAAVMRSLPSGLQLVLVEQPALGTAAVELRIAAGSLDDRPGVAQLAMDLVRHGAGWPAGGARGFDAALAEIGGRLDTAVGPHALRLDLVVAAEHAPAAARLLVGAATRHPLRGTAFARLRHHAIDRARARLEVQPESLVRDMLLRSLLGAGAITSRRAVRASSSELGRVRLAHVGAYFAKHWQPEHAALLVAGRFDAAGVLAAARAGWPGHTATAGAPPVPAPIPNAHWSARSYLVDRPAGPHSTVGLGLLLDTGQPLPRAALELLRSLLATQVQRQLEAAVRSAERPRVDARLLVATPQQAALALLVEVPAADTPAATTVLAHAAASFADHAALEKRLVEAKRRSALRLAEQSRIPEALVHLAGSLVAGRTDPQRYHRYPRALLELDTTALAQWLRAAVHGRVLAMVADRAAVGPPPAGFPPPTLVDADRGFAPPSTRHEDR